MIIKPEIFDTKRIGSMQTTRVGGCSQAPYDGMNLGCFGEDPVVDNNLALLQEKHCLPHRPVFLKQVHGDRVVEYRQTPQHHGQFEADACFTRQKNIICAVLSADCLPVLLTDKSATFVAAIHCGWRGLYANILKKTVAQLEADPKDIQCWLGPCISYQPYRVDEAFRARLVQRDPSLTACFYQHKKTGWHADLKKIAVEKLHQIGIHEMAQSAFCTHDNPALFYSYRRDQDTGRMASMVWLRD